MSGIVVINNYVDYPKDDKICQHTNPNTIMFLGKMDYEPNITAVSYFVNTIFPQLRELYKNLKFIIVGAKPTKDVLNLQNYSGVEVTGFVDSIEPYFHDSTIVIAPMLSGAGVQNKIIQAMSYGCCVATTTIGAEGISLKGNEIAIFNSDNEWLKGLSHLLSNKNLRLKMGKEARKTIVDTLSKERIYEQFKQLLKGL